VARTIPCHKDECSLKLLKALNSTVKLNVLQFHFVMTRTVLILIGDD